MMPMLKLLLLTYSKQIYFINVFRRFYCEGSTHSSLKLTHFDLIKKISGSPDEDVIKSMKKNQYLQNMTEEEVSYRLNRLNSYDLQDKNPLEKLNLVKIHPKTVRHRVLVLKELGVSPKKITTQILSKYLTYVKKDVNSLKEAKIIDEKANVMQNLLRLTPLNSSCIEKVLDDSHSSDEIRIHILKKLLENQLGFSEPISEEWNMFQRLRHKSIVELLRVLSILQHDIKMPMEKIRNNPFLWSAMDADNTLELMANYPTLGGVEIRVVLNNHCKILASSLQNFVKIHQYLKEAEITEEALSKCFEVFTLNSETVRERLEECKKNSRLSMCWHHPRMLELIIYQNKAIKRIEKLNSVNCSYTSVTLLSSADKLFDRFFEGGSYKFHGKEYLYYLCKELNCSRDEIKTKLMKHPFWNFGSLFIVTSNVKALRSKGFSSEDILNEICILLYPTNMILEELERVASRPESDVCKDENGELKKKFILPLVVYFIERDSNFEGKAIWFWESGTFSPKQDSSDVQVPLTINAVKKSKRTINIMDS